MTAAGRRWSLLSAEARHAEHPDSFDLPSRAEREAIRPGQAAKLLFAIETAGDRGVDRMWVVVTAAGDDGYSGVLVNDPGRASDLDLADGDSIRFKPEHVAAIDTPPRSFLVERFRRRRARWTRNGG